MRGTALMLAMVGSVRYSVARLRSPVKCVLLACGSCVLMWVMPAHWIVFVTLPQPSIISP